MGVLNADAQTNPSERAFPQSKAEIEKALKGMQANLAGHLPVLEGFAKPGEHPLDQYQRGYYQVTVQVSPAPSGKSVVRVSAKVTAWYNDAAAAHSGYQLLTSNGRIESDLLDQLADQLAASASKAKISNAEKEAAVTPAQNPSAVESAQEPANLTPSAPSTTNGNVFSSSMNQSLTARENMGGRSLAQPAPIKVDSALQTEAANLEEVLKNQAHPKNLVAVKKSGTPVVASPSLTAKSLFLASMHDEFEMLDFNLDWVHVRISGLSRGWIWRNSVEMPEGIPDTTAQSGRSPTAVAADLFHVVREETAPFPGDWEPLRSKSVKILSVQKMDEDANDPGPKERLEYVKFQLENSYVELVQKPQGVAGIVFIFDSADGGMIAATATALQQWRAGTLSDAALWHKCFFDPPETFDSAASPGSQ